MLKINKECRWYSQYFNQRLPDSHAGSEWHRDDKPVIVDSLCCLEFSNPLYASDQQYGSPRRPEYRRN